MSLYKPEKKLPNEVGRGFTSARLGLNLTIEELAQKANVGPLDVQLWETGPECLKPLQGILGALNQQLVITKKRIVLLDQNDIFFWND